jgi:histidine ammonia-lyase
MTAARGIELRAPLVPGPATAAAIAVLREEAPGPGPDRFLAPDIEASYRLVTSGRLVAAALLHSHESEQS